MSTERYSNIIQYELFPYPEYREVYYSNNLWISDYIQWVDELEREGELLYKSKTTYSYQEIIDKYNLR